MSQKRTPTSTSEPFTLWVSRVASGTELVCRTLSDDYFGLFVHWVRGRSRYCPPEGCPLCKQDRLWKGYLPVDIWEPVHRHYYPTVLEITEHCELDLRDKIKRGQYWKFKRPADVGKKSQPCFAACLGLVEGHLPPAFSILPTLHTVFHIFELGKSQANPLPRKTVVESSQGAPPPGHEPPAPANKPTEGQWEQLRESLKGAYSMPRDDGRSESRNGKH